MPGVLKRQVSSISSYAASSSTTEYSSSTASSTSSFTPEAATASSSGSVSSTVSDGQSSTASNTTIVPATSTSAPSSSSNLSSVPTSADTVSSAPATSSFLPSSPSSSSTSGRTTERTSTPSPTQSSTTPTSSPTRPSATSSRQLAVTQSAVPSTQPSESETSSSLTLVPVTTSSSSTLSVVSFTLSAPNFLTSISPVNVPLSFTSTPLATSSPSSATGSANVSDASTDVSTASSHKSKIAAVIGTTTTFGGLALIAVIGYFVFWCRTHRKSSASIRSAQAPLWHQGGAARPSNSGSSSRASSPRLRPGHASGMDMVQVSRDPFAASSHGHESTLRVETPSLGTPAPLLPRGEEGQQMYENAHFSGRLTEWSVHSLPPTYPAGTLDPPVIRVSTATSDAEGSSPWGREPPVPLETPEDERYIRNPFEDPDYMTSTSTLGSIHIDEAYGGVIRESTVDSVVAKPVDSRHLTLKSFRADYINGSSPVDQIDRFWDISTEPGSNERKLSPMSGSPSSDVLLRSMSPGPLSSGTNSPFPTPT